MAIVPIQQGPSVKLQPLDTTPLRPADVTAGTRGLGEAIQGAGKAGMEYAQRQDAINAVGDEAAIKDVDNQYVAAASDLKTHYGALSGKDALEQKDAYEKALKDKVAELSAAVAPNGPRQIRMAHDILQRRLAGDLADIGAHAVTQNKQYFLDESKGRLALSASAAGNAYLNPAEAERNISTALSETDSLSKMSGLGPEATAASRLKTSSGIRKDIGTRLVYEGSQGPDVAAAYVEKYGDQFTSDDAQSVLDHVRVQRNSIAAEQRRIANEAKAQDRQARADAADNAEDKLRILNTGTPLPPQVVAQAISDARFAKKPGLEFSVGQASFKNDLNVEYRSSTPAEIQDRLNVLGPKIAAAGKNASAQDVVEFSHLTQIKTQSEADLQKDSISWGADHLGLPTGALNWNDAASLSQRIANARTVTARTGVQSKFFTDEEAATLAPAAASPDIKQQGDVVARLSKLGANYGSIAARQIAPHDPAFWGLVGLATVPGRGVGAALVSQVLQGREVLKSRPKIIDPSQADPMFDQAIGGALRLMPDASGGIRANARAIFAATAHQQGHDDWNSASGMWNSAVNASLGAYRGQDGVRRGGLGSWAGATTVLPDGMSQPEFEQRISRATAPAMIAAGNGLPVWSNGQALKLHEVKAMQMVPVGDGRYRLSSGSGYVQKKGGGFYELDVNRIPH